MIIIRLLRELNAIGKEPVVSTKTDQIFIRALKLFSGISTIIDDIFLFCRNIDAILLYLECVCRMFQKYRVSFWLDKCDFLKDRIEYVGHGIIAQVNCPAQSKFDLIKNWELPKNGQALFLFIGLVQFYHRCAPYFEIRMKFLRRFIKIF